jgi:Uma2 family endonuclease
MAERATLRTQSDWTYRDLDDLPADLERYELWEGELIISPAPTVNHQELVGRIHSLFVMFDPQKSRGRYFVAPVDVILGEKITVQPDMLWVAKANEDIIKDKHIVGAPDLCIEVMSPGSEEDDRDRKRRYYAEGGVREYWLLDSVGRTLSIYDLGRNTHTVYEEGALAQSTLPELAGLTVDVRELFAGL